MFLRHHRARCLSPRRAFTAVELLVVMAIILLLIAILLPTMRDARAVAKIAHCSSNQKQLSYAWLQYASDNVLALVGSHPGEPNSWAMDGAGEAPLEEGRLWRYLGDHGVYRCVSDPRGFMRSYSVNHFLAGRPRDVQDWRIDPVYSLNRVTKPVQTLVFIDEDDHREWNRGSWVIEPHGEQDRWIDWPGGWHTVGIQRGGDPLSYVDGHVETYWFQDPDNTLAVEAFYTPAPNSPDLYWFRDRYNPR